MGGGTSKFEDNDWNQADGLIENHELETIDGMPPTSKYAVYDIIKKGINQREFDVVDSGQNLVYTTKAVPGTLAWFDVLGPRSCGDYEDLLLRVQVDLSRRTWIVYRYHKPVFDVQKPTDMVPCKGLEDGVLLYKAACITVSWSRYVAVVARYGPPSLDDYVAEVALHPNDILPSDDTDEDADELLGQAQKVAERRRHGDTTSHDHDKVDSNAKQVETNKEATGDQLPKSKATQDSPGAKTNQPELVDGSVDSASSASKGPLRKYLSSRYSMFGATQDTNDATATETTTQIPPYEIALEGIIDLDNSPLLECQEIYNRIIGNHQTAIVTKDRVVQLLRLDQAQHLKEEQETEAAASFVNRKTLRHQHEVEDQEDAANPLVQAVHTQEAIHPSAAASKQTTTSEEADKGGWFARLHQSFSHVEEQRQPQKDTTWLQAKAKEAEDRPPDAPTNEMDASIQLVLAKQQQQRHKNWLSGISLRRSTPEQHQPARNPEDIEEALSHRTLEEMAEPVSNAVAKAPDPASLPSILDQEEGEPAVTHKVEDDGAGSKTWLSLKRSTPSKQQQPAGNPEAMEEAMSHCTLEEMAEPIPTDSAATTIAPDPATLPSILDVEGTEGEPTENDMANIAAVNGDDIKSTMVDSTATEISNLPEGTVGEKTEGEPGQVQPLVGYWTWKNTYSVHKMELHLARNSDLALHIVLAILANQVRYERNAIAMTV